VESLRSLPDEDPGCRVKCITLVYNFFYSITEKFSSILSEAAAFLAIADELYKLFDGLGQFTKIPNILQVDLEKSGDWNKQAHSIDTGANALTLGLNLLEYI
jgi:hypothetical protein